MGVDVFGGDVRQRGRLPFRASVLVDKGGTDALIELVAQKNLADKAVFKNEGIFHGNTGIIRDLFCCELQAGR